MKALLLFVMIGGGAITACAQDKQHSLAAGIDVATPVYTAVGDMKGILTGVFIKKEWRWSKRFAGTASAGYSYFNGSVSSFDEKEVHDFAVVPVLAGLRYYARNKYYAGLEAGVGIRAHKNASTKFTLAPAVGVLVPIGGKSIDLGLRFYTIPSMPAIPEATVLHKGGYSLLGLRAGLVL